MFENAFLQKHLALIAHFDGNLLPDCSGANTDHAYCCCGKNVEKLLAILGQEVVVVEEFVYLGCLVQSTTQSSPDTSRLNTITRAAMQNLDNKIWKSRIVISTKLKLYITCILSVFLYGSECWAVTKRDVLQIDALDQWCLRKLLGIKSRMAR